MAVSLEHRLRVLRHLEGTMAITRDQNYPDAPAQLLLTFNHCCDGHDIRDVIEAAGNLLMAAVGFYAREAEMTEQEAMEYARSCCRGVFAGIEQNWHRKSEPTDVEVRSN